MQTDRLNLDIVLLQPLRQNMPIRTVVCANSRQRLQMAVWQISLWEGPEHSWQVRLRLVALGSYKYVLTGIDTDPGLGFAYPV